MNTTKNQVAAIAAFALVIAIFIGFRMHDAELDRQALDQERVEVGQQAITASRLMHDYATRPTLERGDGVYIQDTIDKTVGRVDDYLLKAKANPGDTSTLKSKDASVAYEHLKQLQKELKDSLQLVSKLNGKLTSLESDAEEVKSRFKDLTQKNLQCYRPFDGGTSELALECVDMSLQRRSVLIVTQEQFSSMKLPLYGMEAVESLGAQKVTINNSNEFQHWNTEEMVPTYRLVATNGEIAEANKKLADIHQQEEALKNELVPALLMLKNQLAPQGSMAASTGVATAEVSPAQAAPTSETQPTPADNLAQASQAGGSVAPAAPTDLLALAGKYPSAVSNTPAFQQVLDAINKVVPDASRDAVFAGQGHVESPMLKVGSYLEISWNVKQLGFPLAYIFVSEKGNDALVLLLEKGDGVNADANVSCFGRQISSYPSEVQREVSGMGFRTMPAMKDLRCN